jgi:UDP-N-acetylglucosamine:LPS N-acetylglucosamine transferase
MVGPIVAPGGTRVALDRAGLLVHLGGCEGASQSAEAYRAYGAFALKSILASGLVAAYSHQVTIVGGARCIGSLRREFGASGFEFLSLSPAEMEARVRAAALVLTAPGPTNVLECFHLRSPVCFLPPQNYSQWCTLRRLVQQELAPWALNWDEAYPDLPLRERMPEIERKPVVQEALRRMTNDDDLQRDFAARLSRLRQIDLVDLAHRQTTFFRGLGSNGAQAIARQLLTQDSLLQGAA